MGGIFKLIVMKSDSGVKFRNYKPRDETLRKYMIERPAIPTISNEINEKLKIIAAQEPDLV